MNREILFKAKRLDNGEWFEGVPVEYRVTEDVKTFLHLKRTYTLNQVLPSKPYFAMDRCYNMRELKIARGMEIRVR